MDSTYSIDESPILISIRNCLFNGARGRDNPPGRWEKVKQLKKHHCRRRRHRRVSVFNYEFYFWDQPRCATFSCFCFCTFFFFFVRIISAASHFPPLCVRDAFFVLHRSFIDKATSKCIETNRKSAGMKTYLQGTKKQPDSPFEYAKF